MTSPKIPKYFLVHRLFSLSGFFLVFFFLKPSGIKNLINHHLAFSIIVAVVFIFYVVFGLILLFQSGRSGSLLYILHRASGVVALFYIILQVAYNLFKIPLLYDYFYLIVPIGVIALCFYFSLAFWHALIGFGVTVSVQSQKTMLLFCFLLFLILVAGNFFILFK